MNTTLTFKEAVEIVCTKLKKEKNIKMFCDEHKLCYLNVLDLKNHKGLKYPDIVKELLKIYLDLDVNKEIFFVVRKKNKENE